MAAVNFAAQIENQHTRRALPFAKGAKDRPGVSVGACPDTTET